MQSDAIVLDTTDHGESDLIVTLFSHDSGRLSAIAKGAKKSKKRFVNKLEIFTYLQIHYQQKNERTLAFLSEAELHNCFPNIRHHLDLYGIASIIREFLLLGIKDGEPDSNIFRLSLWAFQRLDSKESPQQTLVLFLIHFFNYIGYRPDFWTCANCREDVQPDKTYRFNSASGQLICSNCDQHGKTGRPLSYGTIRIIQNSQDQPLERLHRLKFSGAILSESLHLLHNFGRQIFQREIVSWQILNQQKKVYGTYSPFH
ncbi:MAG: DNA repair protein RecO (recombination protein O) [Desulforhopalus sp.]|jgi:DNA repair protein RecO (recombination protein O)